MESRSDPRLLLVRADYVQIGQKPFKMAMMTWGNEIRHMVEPGVYMRGQDLFEHGQATVVDVRRYQTHVNITSTCVGSRGDEYRQNNNLYFVNGQLDMFTSHCRRIIDEPNIRQR